MKGRGGIIRRGQTIAEAGEREKWGKSVREKWSLTRSYKGLTMLSENLFWNVLPIKRAVSGDIQGLVPVICVKVPGLFSPGMKYTP
jgi:hypothetical protein